MAATSFAAAAALAATEPCPICFDDMKTSVKNQCGHSVCFSCQIECHRRGQSLCSQCRAPCEKPTNLNAPEANQDPHWNAYQADLAQRVVDQQRIINQMRDAVAAPAAVRHCSVCNSVRHSKPFHRQRAWENQLQWHQRLYAEAKSPVPIEGYANVAKALHPNGTYTLVVPIN